ncbi:hypothetical protein B9Z65_6342 [Elsinoe australis]|uniref:Uncharacterized protein n=1 Tax=Elsinoe australis TaxID=40998 RepID=A0A2P8A8D0_9PEZI|nr:hypothetical protein B9Z65_6342 [Elsinoe australis]
MRKPDSNLQKLDKPIKVSFSMSDERARLVCLINLIETLHKEDRSKMLSDMVPCICKKKRSMPYWTKADPDDCGKPVPAWWPTEDIRYSGPHHLKIGARLRLALFMPRMHWTKAEYEQFNQDAMDEQIMPDQFWLRSIDACVKIRQQKNNATAMHNLSPEQEENRKNMENFKNLLVAEYHYVRSGKGASRIFHYTQKYKVKVEELFGDSLELFLTPWKRQARQPVVDAPTPPRPSPMVSLPGFGTAPDHVSPASRPLFTSVTRVPPRARERVESPPSTNPTSASSSTAVISPMRSLGLSPIAKDAAAAHDSGDPVGNDCEVLPPTPDHPDDTTKDIWDWTTSYGISTEQLLESWFPGTIPYPSPVESLGYSGHS